MKSVILGNDFLKDTDGSFKIIETNTSCGFPLKNIGTYFNKSNFDTFLTTNGITKIDLINPPSPFIMSKDLDGFDHSLPSTLYMYLLAEYSETIAIQLWKPENNVVPYIEDEDDRLIIRIAYDSNALIDDTYCRDNYSFLKLMHENDSSSIPNTYFTNGSDLTVDSIGTTIVDNGNLPNFLIKLRYPSSDHTEYPKLLKVSTVEELESLKSLLSSSEILQEYIVNSNDLVDNRLHTYRHLQFLYGGDLTELDLFEPYTVTNKCEITSNIDYNDSNEAQVWERPKLLQKVGKSRENTPHSFSNERVFMSDGSTEIVDNISLLDTLKSVDLFGLSDDGPSYGGWGETKENVLPRRKSHYAVNVVEAGEPSDVNLSQKLELIDGTTYTLTFDAWSNMTRTIICGIGLSADPWNNTSETVVITETRSTYTSTLVATDFGEEGILCRVLFDLGDIISEVNIDSVNLKIGDGDNLLSNGNFELGNKSWISGVDDESPAPVVHIGSELNTTTVSNKTQVSDGGNFFIYVTFTDGKIYKDISNSHIVIVRGGKCRFGSANTLVVGDEVVVGNISGDTLNTLTVSSVGFLFEGLIGYNVDVEEEDVFLRPFLGDGGDFIIKHNRRGMDLGCQCYYEEGFSNCNCNDPCISDPEECPSMGGFIDCCGSEPFCSYGSAFVGGECGTMGKQ